MEVRVYLLVTDIHFDFEKENRLNYFSEILTSLEDIIDIAKGYRSKGYSVNLIFMGDVLDRSISDSSLAMQALEILKYFCNQFDNCYSVVGNHELTYAKDNPFWYLVSRIEGTNLNSVKRYIQPRGLNSTVIIPDCLEFEDVRIYFNHYGVEGVSVPQDKINIGLFHQNIGSNSICQMWGNFLDVEQSTWIPSYNYCFFAHVHLAKGKYYVDKNCKCLCTWLGTIGRTKVTEILDDSLDVVIPAIIIKDNRFSSIEENLITLKSSAECIDKQSLEKSTKRKKLIEEQKNVSTRKYTGKSLYETLKGKLAGTELDMMFDILSKPTDNLLVEYRTMLDSVKIEGIDNNGK